MGLDDVHRGAGERGFVTRHDVRTAGVPSSSFTAHARTIGWAPRHRALWVPTGLTLSHEQVLHAAVTSIDGRVLVTGASALFLDGVLDRPPERAELLVDAARTPAARDGVCLHRTTTFAGVRGRNRGPLQLAETARAFADLAAHATVDELCLAIAAALRTRRCTLDALERELARRKRFPGRANLRLALALMRGEVTHSGNERLARRLLRRAGMVPLPRPLTVLLIGAPAAEIDIPFPDIHYGVEADGPHHLVPSVATADRQRDRRLRREGWEIDRFWWYEIEQRQTWLVQEVSKRWVERGGDPSLLVRNG